MTRIDIDITDPAQMQEIVARIAAEMPDIASQALWEEGALVMNEAQRRCPKDTGLLRNTRKDGTEAADDSRQNDPAVIADGAITLEIGFYKEYAAFVHEGIAGKSTAKNYTTSGTGPKFLEGPIMERQDLIAPNIVKRVLMRVREIADEFTGGET
jgi:hypothetical protein